MTVSIPLPCHNISKINIVRRLLAVNRCKLALSPSALAKIKKVSKVLIEKYRHPRGQGRGLITNAHILKEITLNTKGTLWI